MDIKKEEGKDIKALIRKSDVFIENFRPGAMDKLGFSYDEFSKLNPKSFIVLPKDSSKGLMKTGLHWMRLHK